MLDLDKYINNSIGIKLNGEVYDILEPTVRMNMEVDRIESDMTRENLNEKRLEVAEVLMNHNKQGATFTKEELKDIPFEALSMVIAEIAMLRLKAEKDPNSESQSQTER